MARTCKQQGCKNAVPVGWQGTLSAECAVSTAAHPGRPGTAARSGCGTEGLCPAQHPAGPGPLLLCCLLLGHGLKGLRHFPASSLSVLGLVYWAWLFLGLVYQSTVVTKEFILSIFSVLMFLSYSSFPFHPSLILLEAREGIFSPIVIFCLSLRG